MRKVSLSVAAGGFLGGIALCVSAQVSTNRVRDISLPPLPPSPVEDFRRWLVQTPEQRTTSLASKTPEQRRYLLSKLTEYQALSLEQREAKLQVLDLRWYLRPLMEITLSERTNRIARIPEKYREVVRERLQQWDALPPDLQMDVLENEWTMHYCARSTGSPAQREELFKNLDPIQRILLDQKISRWDSISPERRERMYGQFNSFFQLPPTERTKTLNVMSESERAEMERTLAEFEKLPAAQRKVCIQSFEKFTNMNVAERREFLRDAARWQAMSEKERKAWRNLVTALPPMPDTSPLPPFPPSRAPSPLTASNSPAPAFPVQ